MKTIEERAKEYALRYDDKWQVAMFKAYIQGATEQQEIDNEQLCEMVLDNQNAMVDKACEWLREFANFSVNDNTGSLDEQDLVENFRKAMSNKDKY